MVVTPGGKRSSEQMETRDAEAKHTLNASNSGAYAQTIWADSSDQKNS